MSYLQTKKVQQYNFILDSFECEDYFHGKGQMTCSDGTYDMDMIVRTDIDGNIIKASIEVTVTDQLGEVLTWDDLGLSKRDLYGLVGEFYRGE